jgi:hypothetical protein
MTQVPRNPEITAQMLAFSGVIIFVEGIIVLAVLADRYDRERIHRLLLRKVLEDVDDEGLDAAVRERLRPDTEHEA